MNTSLTSQTILKNATLWITYCTQSQKNVMKHKRDSKIQVVMLKNVINILYYIQKEQNPLYKFQKAFCDS